MTPHLPLGFALLWLCTFAGPTAAFEAQCPQVIETTQQLASKAPPDWTEFSRDPWGTAGAPSSEQLHNKSGFSQIEVYDGPPREIADFIPDNARDTWTLGNPKERVRPELMA